MQEDDLRDIELHRDRLLLSLGEWRRDTSRDFDDSNWIARITCCGAQDVECSERELHIDVFSRYVSHGFESGIESEELSHVLSTKSRFGLRCKELRISLN